MRLTRYFHNYVHTSNQILKVYPISLSSAEPEEGSKDTFHSTELHSTMADPASRPSLVSLLTTYRDYLRRAEMDTLCG